VLEIYALRGEVESVLDGPAAGERESRMLLMLAPQHPPPARETPTFLVPFENARRWAGAAGSLRVEHAPPVVSPTAKEFSVAERIVSDPLAMVAGAAVSFRPRDGSPFVQARGLGLGQRVPIGAVWDARRCRGQPNVRRFSDSTC
jgi:hypothetical protein